jgi:hypothetical protein
MTGGWRKLYNEELHNFYLSLNFIRVLKSRRMGWARHVAHMGETRNTKCSLENFQQMDLLKVTGG